MRVPKMAGLAQGGKKTAKSVQRYATRNPKRTAAMGIGGVGGAGYMVSGRRGRGVDRAAPGRPTGMYRF
jgi:hypothetical protein